MQSAQLKSLAKLPGVSKSFDQDGEAGRIDVVNFREVEREPPALRGLEHSKKNAPQFGRRIDCDAARELRKAFLALLFGGDAKRVVVWQFDHSRHW